MANVTQPDPSTRRGIRVKLWHIMVFMVGLAVVVTVVRDLSSEGGVGWGTLLEIVIASGIACGGVLWLFARAKRRIGAGPGGPA